jgi:hypothetical protein
VSKRVRLAFGVCGAIGAALLVSGAASAADLGAVDQGLVDHAAENGGVPCEAPEVVAFESVWLGHFSGGYSHKLGPGLPVVLDWRDEKLCFPARRACDRYMSAMRREFHRPEGYFTCLPIR